MGYQPNPMVTALMEDRRRARPTSPASNLAFLHYYPREEQWKKSKANRILFAGAEAQAAQLGYNLLPIWGASPNVNPKRLSTILRAKGMSGIVLAPLPNRIRRLELDWSNFAVAAMGFTLDSPRVHRAGTFQYHSIPLAVRELHALGYQRIAIGIFPGADARVDHAWEASLALLGEEDYAPLPLRMPFEDPSSQKFKTWIKRHRIDAFINADLPGMPKGLIDAGYRIPEDMGYVSLLSDEFATVRRDWRGIGAEAVTLVHIQLMRNERGVPERPKTVLIEGEWSPGTSVRSQTPQHPRPRTKACQ